MGCHRRGQLFYYKNDLNGNVQNWSRAAQISLPLRVLLLLRFSKRRCHEVTEEFKSSGRVVVPTRVAVSAGNKSSQLFCLQNDRGNHWVIVTQSVGYGCNATGIDSMGKPQRGYNHHTERKKEEYKEVISLLKRGYSVRNTAKLCFTNPLLLGKVNTFPLHSLNRGFQA